MCYLLLIIEFTKTLLFYKCRSSYIYSVKECSIFFGVLLNFWFSGYWNFDDLLLPPFSSHCNQTSYYKTLRFCSFRVWYFPICLSWRMLIFRRLVVSFVIFPSSWPSILLQKIFVDVINHGIKRRQRVLVSRRRDGTKISTPTTCKQYFVYENKYEEIRGCRIRVVVKEGRRKSQSSENCKRTNKNIIIRASFLTCGQSNRGAIRDNRIVERRKVWIYSPNL